VSFLAGYREATGGRLGDGKGVGGEKEKQRGREREKEREREREREMIIHSAVITQSPAP